MEFTGYSVVLQLEPHNLEDAVVQGQWGKTQYGVWEKNRRKVT